MSFESVPIGLLTPGALLGIVIWLILVGRLVPRRTYDDMKEDRDHWRTAHSISEAARQVSAEQVSELLEHSRAANAFMGSLDRFEPRKEERR